MGYSGKWGEKLKAQTLRRRGLSYKEILKHVNVAKSTLSTWCKDIELTSKQMERLYKRQETGQRKGSVIAARKKQLKRWEEEQKERNLGIKDIGKLSKRERFLLGVALYAAEGGKTSRGEVDFSNTDPLMIKFMVAWFREFCNPPEQKLRVALWIHDDLDESAARKFWSKLTGIPLIQFNKSYIAQNKKNSKKIRKKKHEYGVAAIGFSSVKIKRRILGWIGGILGQW